MHGVTGFVESAALLVFAAFVLVTICSRIGVPSIVGYILAGIVIGPAGLGLIASGVPRRVGDLCREPPARFVAIVGDGDGVTPLAGSVGAAVFAGPLWGLTDMRRFAHIEGEGAHLSTPASGNARDATVYGEVGGPARIYIVHGGGHLVFNEDLWRRRLLPRRWLFLASEKVIGSFWP